MKIGKSIVFDVENQIINVKTLIRLVFGSSVGNIRVKKTKSVLTSLWLSRYYRKSPNATLKKLCSNKGYISAIITGKFNLEVILGLKWII